MGKKAGKEPAFFFKTTGMKLSDNFSLKEFTSSATAARFSIDNTPGKEEVLNIKELVKNILQPARDAMGAIFVSSGYRSQGVNTIIGGALNSQHMKGQAADIKSSDMAQLFEYIKNNLPFDQLIWEFGDDKEPQWIHVSYNKKGNRGEVLRAKQINHKTIYTRLND